MKKQAKQENQQYNTNNQIYQKYYETKRIAMVMEENNNSKIIAIPSLTKGAKDEWLKLGGNSAYFYKYLIAPRLHKNPPLFIRTPTLVIASNPASLRFTGEIRSSKICNL